MAFPLPRDAKMLSLLFEEKSRNQRRNLPTVETGLCGLKTVFLLMEGLKSHRLRTRLNRGTGETIRGGCAFVGAVLTSAARSLGDSGARCGSFSLLI